MAAVSLFPHLIRGLSISLPRVLGIAAAATAATAATATTAAIISAPTKLRWNHDSPRNPTPPPSPSPPPETDRFVLEMLMNQLLYEAIEKIKEEGPADKEILCRASGPLKNHTKQVLILKDTHEWCGRFLSGLPSEKARGNKDRVVHQGAPPKGSKAAAVYASDDYHWIVAWHVPFPAETNHHVKNKIYVEYGPDVPIDWDRIEKKLDTSSNEKKCAGAWAKIEDGSDAAFSILFTE